MVNTIENYVQELRDYIRLEEQAEINTWVWFGTEDMKSSLLTKTIPPVGHMAMWTYFRVESRISRLLTTILPPGYTLNIEEIDYTGSMSWSITFGVPKGC